MAAANNNNNNSNENPKSLAEIAKVFEEKIELHDRKYRLKPYKNVFLGSSAVSLLVRILKDEIIATTASSSTAVSRKHGEVLAQTLQERFRLFAHVEKKESMIVDDYYIYKFTATKDRLAPPEEDENEKKEYFRRLFNDEIDPKDEDDEGFDDAAVLEMLLESVERTSNDSNNPWFYGAESDDSFAGGAVASSGVDIRHAAQALETTVKVKTHRYQGKEYADCFVGSDAVDVLLACGMAKDRKAAQELGRKLETEHNLFRSCTNDDDDHQGFEDNYYFYSFTHKSERRGLGDIQKVTYEQKDLEKIAQDFKEHVRVKDRNLRLKSYRQSFVGSQAVSYLVNAGYATNRFEGVALGKRLAGELHLFGEAGTKVDTYDFRDDYHFYSFNDDDNEAPTEEDEEETKAPTEQGPEIKITVEGSDMSAMDAVAESAAWKRSVQKFESRALLREAKEEENMKGLGRGFRWMQSFRRLDPRYRILAHFRKLSQLGVENINKDMTKIHPLLRIWYLSRRRNIFTVWREVTDDPIRRMMSGEAVGKGLDIKGKSAKRGKHSGFVPFLQIGDNRHKLGIKPFSKKARIRIFFHPSGIEKALEHVKTTAKTMVDKVAQANQILLNESNAASDRMKDAQETLEAWDMTDPSIILVQEYAPQRVGLEIPVRLFWEAFISDADITRIPGSEYDTDRPSMPLYQEFNIDAVCAKEKEGAPKAVIWQDDRSNPLNPLELLMAYEEGGRVMPVASDFDAFLIGTRRVDYDPVKDALPGDELKMLNWSIEQTGKILNTPPRPGSWTKRWLENKVREDKRGTQISKPRMFGYADPKSYSIVEDAVKSLSADGSVRHGAESFNFTIPQEMESKFLVVSDSLGKIQWKMFSETQLRHFLSDKIDEGFTFPLNPKWILCDPGWKELYDKLIRSETEEVVNSMNIWFPPGVREKIESISSKHPWGFEGAVLRSQEKVQERFKQMLIDENKVFRKSVQGFLRRGVKGEKIVTTTSGILETENIVRDNTSWVAFNNSSGAYHVLTNDDFESSYDSSTLRDIDPKSVRLPEEMARRLREQGYKECQPKRRVFAHIVDSDDIHWFRSGQPQKSNDNGKCAYFIAPWGEYSRVEKGDVLVMQYPAGSKDDVYRIERSAFKDTYQPEHRNQRLSSKELSIRFFADDDVPAGRNSSGLEGQPLRSQEEVQAKFLPLLRSEGRVHSKLASTTTYIRPAIKGETFVSVIDGKQETENTVTDDTSYVVCGKAAGEFYIITGDVFQSRYDVSSAKPLDLEDKTTIPRLIREKFQEYKSIPTPMYAREVESDDIDWFNFDNSLVEEEETAYFTPPWGGWMVAKKGDMLVTQVESGDDGVYRIERSVFAETYKVHGGAL